MGKLKDFLKMYKRKSTAAAYRWALTEFFKTVYGENEHSLEARADQYFVEKRN